VLLSANDQRLKGRLSFLPLLLLLLQNIYFFNCVYFTISKYAVLWYLFIKLYMCISFIFDSILLWLANCTVTIFHVYYFTLYIGMLSSMFFLFFSLIKSVIFFLLSYLPYLIIGSHFSIVILYKLFMRCVNITGKGGQYGLTISLSLLLLYVIDGLVARLKIH
jgi:hypothetical protein